jgi:preprotein translocase subunit SecA
MARRSKKRRKRPDDYYQAGPFEIARFGNVIVSRWNASADDSKAIHREMAHELPKIKGEIDALVDCIAARVARAPSAELMLRAWWEFAAASALPDKKAEERDAAMQLLEYIQSVIASASPRAGPPEVLKDEDWNLLKADVRTLFKRVSFEYQLSLTAERKQQQKLDMEIEQFRFRAEVFWANVRGERYQAHEKDALLEILEPHSDVLVRLFGIDASTLVSELEKILAKLTYGVHNAFLETESFREETIARIEKLAAESPAATFHELREKVFEDSAFASKRDRVAGEMFGFEMFDVENVTNLPKALLDELTWSPGEDQDFLAPGDFRGWPLRVWPTMKRPFIRLDRRTLCFDMFALFDRFYRVLQRIVLRLEPGYAQTWNDRQKVISETLPLKYFRRLLPGAQVFAPVYYRWKAANGSIEWCETDSLVAYDDHLLVIEVKAGAFTYTSPATDLPAHISSLQGLIRHPASQANRFIDYLDSAAEVSIHDANHTEIGRLRRSDFRHITPCAITLDPMTELAARSNQLKKVGIDLGQRPLWALSIDDLRVYADLIDNPLVFLHFVEQRLSATRSDLLNLDDELDHFGLYLKTNNYSLSAANLAGAERNRVFFTGYRETIDKYYAAVDRRDTAAVPKQRMPKRLAEIIAFLSQSNINGRSEAASFLLDAGGEYREEISAGIDQQLRQHSKLLRTLPLSTHGDMSLTLFVWSPMAPRQAALAIEHTQVVAMASGENTRPLLELEYTADGTLCGVHWQRVTLSGLSSAELRRVQAEAAAFRRRRVSKAEAQGKIGRNDPCPCGSGKKYKRCCHA